MTQTQATDATTPSDRVQRFKAEVAEMRLADPRASRDRFWGFVGAAMMLVGILLGVLGYFTSSGAAAAYNSEGPAEQRDAIVIALIGLTVAVTGAALFLRYSLAQFLRFWLARLIYEQHAQTDRLVESR
jgi:hypothetical protein